MLLPVKVVFLSLTALAHRTATHPPNPPPSKDDKVNKGSLFERYPRLVGYVSEWFVNSFLYAECIVLLLPSGTPTISTLCPGTTSLAHLSSLTPSFLLGFAITMLGAFLRVWCFRTLGVHFMFEVAIKRDHKLISSGPYAYVRHPGYTGIALLLVGEAILACSPNSYINECKIMSTAVGRSLIPWAVFQLYVIGSLMRRSKIEDTNLRGTFGKTWDEYSRAVPKRFIPYIF